ncbi:MAG: Dam family site-specific DNA-(adenine-N6)-methyltransferase [Lachnospiraceae bacterium]|nr:Dam family site-specific DNA-(adenine-N6)-methyltransferase [Lachnospiraceae bacterium]
MAKEYVKSPMNYIGNKFRIIDQIQKWFPKDINTMVDLFCGGCDVTINTDAKNRYANDINYHLVEILEEFQKYSTDYILGYIDGRIDHWHLSKTDIEAYKAFRQYYNETKNPLDLYVLMCYSFNYQFRFNSNHEYNNPFGKNRSSFNKTMRENLIKSLDKLTDVHFTTSQFQDYDYDVLDTGDFLYADPPYLITCGSYNDGKRGFTGWGEKEERDLYGILDDLDNRGVNFALSNVIEHKGKTNTILKDWYKDRGYHLHNIKFDYNNSNYQARNKENVTKEILITNY